MESKGLKVDWATGSEPQILKDLLKSSSSSAAASAPEMNESPASSSSTIKNEKDFESITFMKLRQAQERKRLREMALAEEAAALKRQNQ